MAAKSTILVLAANPLDTQRLRLDEEIRQVREGLLRSRGHKRFTLQDRLAVTPDDLRRALLDLEPRFVDFCDHSASDQGLLLENPRGNGGSHAVSGEALARLLEQFSASVECVVLNSCYSAAVAQPIARTIRNVIGMHK